MTNEFDIPKNYLGNKRDKDSYIENKSAAMITAMIWALRSKDPSTQVGACYINERGRLISVGYNGTPNGWDDDDFTWSKPEQIEYNKYTYVIHAEMNAIFNYSGSLLDFKNSTIYVTFFPCPNCAKHLVQLGVKKVVFLHEPKEITSEVKATKILFNKCGIEYNKYNDENIDGIDNVNLIINSDNEKNFSNIKKSKLTLKNDNNDK